MEAIAKARKLPLSPRKTRKVVATIRNKSVLEALETLKYLPHKPTTYLTKLLQSALANLQGKYKEEKILKTSIQIKAIYVDEGTVLKRIQPRAQGRAFRIRKPTCHVTVRVGSDTEHTLLAGKKLAQPNATEQTALKRATPAQPNNAPKPNVDTTETASTNTVLKAATQPAQGSTVGGTTPATGNNSPKPNVDTIETTSTNSVPKAATQPAQGSTVEGTTPATGNNAPKSNVDTTETTSTNSVPKAATQPAQGSTVEGTTAATGNNAPKPNVDTTETTSTNSVPKAGTSAVEQPLTPSNASAHSKQE